MGRNSFLLLINLHYWFKYQTLKLSLSYKRCRYNIRNYRPYKAYQSSISNGFHAQSVYIMLNIALFMIFNI
ncbi:unnamed protein product [Adineta ricciae]|uniref:Uncharacterized protein n=1 Tax=Adineta ricciae TaxID=249248 RepID=A0A814M8F6_ADIRI|nr:unnamed protein product [Adineta ricciae]